MQNRAHRSAGFTMWEILIVVAIMAVLTSIIVYLSSGINYKRARDSRRKQDLQKTARYLEDYYNDHQRYPQMVGWGGDISGSPWGTTLVDSSYVLPKDPVDGPIQYFYMTDPVSQGFFAIYAKLENTGDPDIAASGCTQGCGPSLRYNYVVHSPNVVMIAGLPQTQMDPGFIPDPGGGQGGGGAGEPSPTEGPSPTLGPSPIPLPTPTPATPPGAGCSFTQCGNCGPCGGTGGMQCGFLSRCWYDDFSGWYCRPELCIPGSTL